MARIRTIKPEFWTDGTMIALSPETRLFYIGTWNFALCDRGHLPDDALGLKLRILPTSETPADELLDELMDAERIIRIEIPDGRTFLAIPRFEDHQKVDPRWNSRCPVCTHLASLNLPETHRRISEEQRDSPELPETQSRKGKERKGKERENVAEIRPDVSRLCELLAGLIESNGSKRPTIGKTWLDAARLMIDNDKRPIAEIVTLIQWCQADTFWRGNILSMPKFRDKYDTLRLQRETKTEKETPVDPYAGRTVIRGGRIVK